MPFAWRRRRPPRISVVVATYNWSSVLRHAVASVLDQTLGDFELLVVGDACTDDSAEVVASFGDRRVRWHNLSEGFGSQVGPNNAGLEMARGELVAYLGHDDLWFPDHLALLVARLEAGDVDLAFTLASIVLPDGGRWVSGLLLDGAMAATDYVVPSSLAHRRDVVARIGPWADHRRIGLPPDAEWQLRARAAGLSFGAVDRLTVLKFPSALRPDSYVTRSDAEQAQWRRRIATEPDLEARELARLLSLAKGGELERIGASDEVFVPPGYVIRRARVVRGLDPGVRVAMEPLAGHVDAASCRVEILEVPRRLPCGGRALARLRLDNRGDAVLASEPPHPVHLSYRWLDAAGQPLGTDGRRSLLPEPLVPGASLTALLEVIAPDATGTYELQPCLVQEHVRWLDEPAEALPLATVEVGGEPHRA